MFFNKIEAGIMRGMKEAFSTQEDRNSAIHATAAAGAAIVAKLPIGLDAWALSTAEIIMVICLAESYGENLSKAAAKGLLLSLFAQWAGHSVALAALEAAEASKVANPLIGYGIKAGVAVGLIETIGHLTIAYYENPDGIGAIACKSIEKMGEQELNRVVNLFASNETEQ